MERYLEPTFIQELRKKAVEYFIGADKYKSSKEARFPKDTPQDRLFQAIAYVRRRGWAEQKLARDLELPVHQPEGQLQDQDCKRFSVREAQRISNRDFLASKGLGDILDELLGPLEPQHADLLGKACVTAVRNGRLRDIATLSEIFESKTHRRSSRSKAERKRDLVPWHHYAAMGAIRFLKQGKIPTRPEVIEAALEERASDECSVMPGIRESKGMRTDPEPAPDQDDPESYYRDYQNEPADDPSVAPAAKHDLPEEERLRILQLHREGITQWQREQQAESRRELKSTELKSLAEEQKSPLMKKRAKQMAAKIEGLRSRQPSNWKRIFKDLGLEQLSPRK